MFLIAQKTEKLLLSASNWTKESDLPIDDEVLIFYENDINGEHFRRQLRMVSDIYDQMRRGIPEPESGH